MSLYPPHKAWSTINELNEEPQKRTCVRERCCNHTVKGRKHQRFEGKCSVTTGRCHVTGVVQCFAARRRRPHRRIHPATCRAMRSCRFPFKTQRWFFTSQRSTRVGSGAVCFTRGPHHGQHTVATEPQTMNPMGQPTKPKASGTFHRSTKACHKNTRAPRLVCILRSSILWGGRAHPERRGVLRTPLLSAHTTNSKRRGER